MSRECTLCRNSRVITVWAPAGLSTVWIPPQHCSHCNTLKPGHRVGTFSKEGMEARQVLPSPEDSPKAREIECPRCRIPAELMQHLLMERDRENAERPSSES